MWRCSYREPASCLLRVIVLFSDGLASGVGVDAGGNGSKKRRDGIVVAMARPVKRKINL